MDKHWSHYCSMSIVHFMAFPETAGGQGPIVASVCQIAEDDFFDAIEIAWIKDPAMRQEVKQILEISGLKLGFCAHPAILSQKLNLNSLDEGQRLEAIRQMEGLMDQAGELGAESFVFLSGPDPGDEQREAAMKALADSVRQMCGYGQEKEIRVTMETFDRRVDKKALIGPVNDARQFAEIIKAEFPDFGLLYDLSHMPILDEVPEDMAVIREHMVHVHVGNCVTVEGRPLYGDLHPYFGFPGGVNDVDELAAFIRELFAIGYLAEGEKEKPWIGFEVKPQGPGQTSELIIANAKRVWRQAWARL
jgi:sugar phosphate isomerase/epimerase